MRALYCRGVEAVRNRSGLVPRRLMLARWPRGRTSSPRGVGGRRYGARSAQASAFEGDTRDPHQARGMRRLAQTNQVEPLKRCRRAAISSFTLRYPKASISPFRQLTAAASAPLYLVA